MNVKRKPKAKMGRPPMPEGTQRTVQVKARVTPAEAARLKTEAKKRGCTISDLLMRPWREGRKGR